MNPIPYIGGIIIKAIVKRTDLPSIFAFIANSLFITCRYLIKNHGLLPTIIGLSRLNSTIQSGSPIATFLNQSGVNPIVASHLSGVVANHWHECIRFAPIINKSFYMYAVGIILSSFTSITYKILIFVGGLILSSLGIVTNQTLASIPFLKYLGLSVLDFFSDHLNFKFFGYKDIPVPSLKDKTVKVVSDIMHGHLPSVSEEVPVSVNTDHSPYFFIGMILLGFVGITISLVLADKVSHETISHIPVLNTYVDYVNSAINSFFQYFSSKPKGPQAPSAPDSNIIPSTWSNNPEPINRVSSGGSDATIKCPSPVLPGATSLVTPPPTPEPILDSTGEWTR